MVRAGACNEDATGTEQPHSPVVDFFVATQRGLQAFFVFCKSGRVQDDGFVPLAFLMTFAEEVEDVRLDAIDIFEPIAVDIGLCQSHGSRRDFNSFNVLAYVRDLDGKSAGVAEPIQCTPVGVTAGSPVIVALIQI